MPEIDLEIITHKLNVDPSFKLIKKKRRKCAPLKNQVVNDEVDRLETNGLIKEVQYPDWLANVVVVKNKNGKNIVCIDFTNLNKACLNDNFPLPMIDWLMDTTTKHKMISFLDAF